MFSKRSFFLRAATIVAITSATQNMAQTIEIDGETITREDGDMSLQQAQNDMDPIRLIEAYLVDKEGPRNERGGWGTRFDNVYEVGEQIDAVIYLANVGKHNPGQEDNPQEMEVYINIRDKVGTVIYHARPVHTFRGVRRLDDPLQDDYFSDRFTVSARVPDPGRYDVGFVFIDKTRSADKQVELEVLLDVRVESPQAAEELTDLTDMMVAGNIEQSYLLRRCAAVFRSQIQLVGKGSFSQAEFDAIDGKVRYFIGADSLINMVDGDVSRDQATSETLAAMKEISFTYMTRMKQNYDAGQHPWADDLMLQRDMLACTMIYDQREVD